MLHCTLCHFATELDDAVLVREDGRCVCLRCYQRETGSARPMPKELQRTVGAVLASLDVAGRS